MTWTEWAGVAASLGILVLAWWPVRLVIAHHAERRFEAAYRRGPDGVIIGAESLLLRGTRPGAVLVLHGYNDSPQAVASMAGALHDAGWTAYAPLLPGHGRTLQAFAESGAVEWIRGAREALARLRRDHEAVAVCGLSMGGALALLLAAEDPNVRAVVGIAPYLQLTWPMRILLILSPVAELGAKYVSGGGRRSVHDPQAAERMIAYRQSTPRLLRELSAVARRAFEALPRLQQPVLIVHSREDNRIPSRLAEAAFARIGSRDKRLEWRTGTGHVLTVDYGHREMERMVVEWLSTRLG
jgi:carboxylesterase